jgi:hypothetical protein
MAANPGERRSDRLILGAWSLTAVGLTGLISRIDGSYFLSYFGDIPPMLAVLSLSIAGGTGLYVLQSRGEVRICERSGVLHGLALSSGMATLFVVAVVVVDLSTGFPKDINVPLPMSALFYPVMAYVAEVVFHIIPLALVLAASSAWRSIWPTRRVIDASLPVVALLEPIFQWYAGYSDKPISGLGIYVFLHVYLFNLLQLHVFRRYDFVSIYGFRLVYYFYWHIVWGDLRLRWLF